MSFRGFIEAFNGTALPRDKRERLMQEVFPQLEHALRDFGIKALIGHDLNRIPPILGRHPDQPRVSEISNPRLNPSAGDHDTIVIALARDGRDVGCACARLKWIEGRLKDAYESQSLLFEHEEDIPLGQHWVCEAEPAERIGSAFIVVSNGLCLLPEEGIDAPAVRTKILRATMRLLGAAVIAEWLWSWYIAHAAPWIAEKHAFETDGFAVTAPDLVRFEKGAAPTHYRLMATDRIRFMSLVDGPGFADVERPLGMIT